MEIITKLDFRILNLIQAYFKCEFLDHLMPAITVFGDHGIIPIIIAIVLLLIPHTRKIGASMGFAFAYGGIIGNLILKNIIGRQRPYSSVYALSILKECELLIDGLSDFSFPSGHSLIAFEFAIVLIFMLKGKLKPISIISLILAFTVAFSRLYLYVHFPTDVIVGAALGTLFGYLGVITADAVFMIINKKLIRKNG